MCEVQLVHLAYLYTTAAACTDVSQPLRNTPATLVRPASGKDFFASCHPHGLRQSHPPLVAPAVPPRAASVCAGFHSRSPDHSTVATTRANWHVRGRVGWHLGGWTSLAQLGRAHLLLAAHRSAVGRRRCGFRLSGGRLGDRLTGMCSHPAWRLSVCTARCCTAQLTCEQHAWHGLCAKAGGHASSSLHTGSQAGSQAPEAGLWAHF